MLLAAWCLVLALDASSDIHRRFCRAPRYERGNPCGCTCKAPLRGRVSAQVLRRATLLGALAPRARCPCYRRTYYGHTSRCSTRVVVLWQWLTVVQRRAGRSTRCAAYTAATPGAWRPAEMAHWAHQVVRRQWFCGDLVGQRCPRARGRDIPRAHA